jgi:hypothetical protein
MSIRAASSCYEAAKLDGKFTPEEKAYCDKNPGKTNGAIVQEPDSKSTDNVNDVKSQNKGTAKSLLKFLN